MKTAIRIFVGGPTELKPLRELVRTIANEVLSSWDDYGHQISIVVKSCDIYKGLQQQKEMNEYIKDETDLVLFILKDSIGDETKKEYRLAASQYAMHKAFQSHRSPRQSPCASTNPQSSRPDRLSQIS